MNTKALERFAQAARRQLLDEVGAKLEQALATDSAELREKATTVQELRKQIKANSKEAVIDRVAYTWFNRFCALRFMDANHYTRAGVVSPLPGHTQPEILQDAKQGHIVEDLQQTIDADRVFALLSGELPSSDPQGEAYRLLLVGVCNQYHKQMPFLFEKIADYTELLMPDDLLSEASLLHAMREAMTDEVCEDIEVVGWLYQFYISEKKDQVIGKVVKSEDIPAATQLFTPNWIVKYMVQNSLGAQWLATYPDSKIREQMEYYIEPAEQTDEVNAQLAAITPSSLDPETMTLIDPASGSGHILVEAYELFKAIYLEMGYTQQELPKLILEKNLYGLEICPRAAQLTGFAVMMKGRADDRRLFERGVKLNVMALVDSAGFDAEGLVRGMKLADYGLKPGDLTELKRLFEHATTFGSLIQVSEELAEKLPALKQLSEATSQDLFVSEALKRLGPLVQQAELLAAQYDAMVANPPYMGGKYMGRTLKEFVQRHYYSAKGDLFACFLLRQGDFVAPTGKASLVTMDAWMFLSGFRDLRSELLHDYAINSLVHVGWNCFPEGHTYNRGVALTVSQAKVDVVGRHLNLSNVPATVSKGQLFLQRRATGADHYDVARSDFLRVPDTPIAYWISPAIRASFENPSLGDIAELRAGITTGDNDRFVRYWSEVSWCTTHTSADSRQELWEKPESRWVPLKSGGDFRKWYGNFDKTIRFDPTAYNELRDMGNRCASEDCYFKAGITWSDIGSTKDFGARYCGPGAVFTTVGHSLFAAPSDVPAIGALLCSKLSTLFLALINPTLHANPGDVARVPFALPDDSRREVERIYAACVKTAALDWDQCERSWDFQSLPLLRGEGTGERDEEGNSPLLPNPSTLESSYTAWITQNRDTIAEMKRLEEENNRLFIDAYGLQDELSPDVPIEQITLTVNPAYRYGKKLEDDEWSLEEGFGEELEARFLKDTMDEFLSYAVGCMLGRYSLDKPGLILANQGDTIAEYLEQVPDPTFMPDEDNVIPILDGDWFTDDIVDRFCQFLRTTFGEEHYQENLAFLEDALGKPLRKYFLKDFYKSHVKRYKKRPIYWVFSSPRGSFNALIYMHRYTPDSVSIVLNDYLREFRVKLASRKEHLEQISISGSASSRDKSSALKEIEKLRGMIEELDQYESEILYPLATQRIEIDLDDGVKVNYKKFGRALQKVTGLST